MAPEINNLRRQIDIANYFFPLLYHVGAVLIEVDYIISLLEDGYAFESLMTKLRSCKSRSEDWLGNYGYMNEEEKIDEGFSIKKTCNEILEFFEIAASQDEYTQIRAKMSYIRTSLFNLKRVSSAELKHRNWRIE
jgi:hypothetical protein